MSKLTFTAFLVCLLLVPAPGAAQEVDPLDTARVRLGNFAFTPAISLNGGYDTNVSREANAFADYTMVAVPQVETWLRLGPTLLSTVSAFEYFGMRRNEPKATFNHFNLLSFGVDGHRLRPSVQVSHRNHYARPTGFEIGERSRRVEDRAGGRLDVEVTARLSLSADVERLRIDWDAAAQYRGSNLREMLNRTDDAATLSASFDLTPLTSVMAGARRVRNRFEFSPERDGDSTDVLGGFTFKSPALVSGSAVLGFRRFRARESGVADFNGLISAVQLAYARQSQTLVLFEANRDPYYSYAESLGYYVLTSIGASCTQTFVGRLEASVYVGRHKLDYRQSGLAEAGLQYTTRRHLGGGLAWRPDRLSRIGFTMRHMASRGGSQFDGWSVIVYVTYGTDRLQRLDRPLPDER